MPQRRRMRRNATSYYYVKVYIVPSLLHAGRSDQPKGEVANSTGRKRTPSVSNRLPQGENRGNQRHHEAAQSVCRSLTGNGATREITVKTQDDIEVAICDWLSRFEQEYMGRGDVTGA